MPYDTLVEPTFCWAIVATQTGMLAGTPQKGQALIFDSEEKATAALQSITHEAGELVVALVAVVPVSDEDLEEADTDELDFLL